MLGSLTILDGPALETALFYLFAAISAGSALAVAASRNIVRTAVYLLLTLVGVAGLYFLLHAEFLAAVQLVVYAGGTLILIIFGVMLTSKSPFSRFQPKAWEVAVAILLGVFLLIALITGIRDTTRREVAVRLMHLPAGVTLPSYVRYDRDQQMLVAQGRLTEAQRQELTASFQADDFKNTANALYERSQTLAATRPLAYEGNYPVLMLGQVLLGDFLIPFEVVSVLLLVVMIGAAYLAKARKK